MQSPNYQIAFNHYEYFSIDNFANSSSNVKNAFINPHEEIKKSNHDNSIRNCNSRNKTNYNNKTLRQIINCSSTHQINHIQLCININEVNPS